MEFLTEPELDEGVKRWTSALSLNIRDSMILKAPALCVLDMQNDMVGLHPRLPVWGGRAIISRIQKLMEAFWQANRPVVFTRHICDGGSDKPPDIGIINMIQDPENFLREGNPGAEVVPELAPSSKDNIILKRYYSAFFRTNLESLLSSLAIKEVIICGVITNVCCETTAHDAFFRNHDLIFTIDGNGGLDEDTHLATLRTIRQSYGKLALMEQVLTSIR